MSEEKYDIAGFRDAIVAGFEKTGGDFDAISKYLDSAGNKLDFNRYGETLFDLLIAGGLRISGSSIFDHGEKPSTDWCIFKAPEELEVMESYGQVFIRLIRRYKYLEKTFEEKMKKMFICIKEFTQSERIKLARMTALWIGNGSLPPTVLLRLINEHLVEDEIALDFLLEFCVTYKQVKGISFLVQILKKGNINSRLMDSAKKQTEEYLRSVFIEKGLVEVVDLHKAHASYGAKLELQQTLLDNMSDKKSHKEIISIINELVVKIKLPVHEVIGLIWSTIMELAEWNTKEFTEEALKHIEKFTTLIQAFTFDDRAELTLILSVQEFCSTNINFMMAFRTIILSFHKHDILSLNTIIKWFEDGHSQKGNINFIKEDFIESLQYDKVERAVASTPDFNLNFDIPDSGFWTPSYVCNDVKVSDLTREHQGYLLKIRSAFELADNKSYFDGYARFHISNYLLETLIGEGNVDGSTTIIQIERFINEPDDSKESKKIINFKNALSELFPDVFDFVNSTTKFDVTKLTPEFIQSLHKVVALGLVECPGSYRKNWAGPSQEQWVYLVPHKIPEKLKILCKNVRESIGKVDRNTSYTQKTMSMVKICALFLEKFLQIHSFSNANGRTGRLLPSWLLSDLSVVPVPLLLSKTKRKVYLECLRDARHTQPTNLSRLVLESLVNTMRMVCVSIDL